MPRLLPGSSAAAAGAWRREPRSSCGAARRGAAARTPPSGSPAASAVAASGAAAALLQYDGEMRRASDATASPWPVRGRRGGSDQARLATLLRRNSGSVASLRLVRIVDGDCDRDGVLLISFAARGRVAQESRRHLPDSSVAAAAAVTARSERDAPPPLALLRRGGRRQAREQHSGLQAAYPWPPWRRQAQRRDSRPFCGAMAAARRGCVTAVSLRLARSVGGGGNNIIKHNETI